VLVLLVTSAPAAAAVAMAFPLAIMASATTDAELRAMAASWGLETQAMAGASLAVALGLGTSAMVEVSSAASLGLETRVMVEVSSAEVLQAEVSSVGRMAMATLAGLEEARAILASLEQVRLEMEVPSVAQVAPMEGPEESEVDPTHALFHQHTLSSRNQCTGRYRP